MTTPATPATPTPLDSERARLRSAGYTDAEISQILIARAASQQPAGTGQGVMSNVLSSIVAVGSHARALIPTFRKDVTTVFDRTATAGARAGATASLVVKAIVVVVLGYAAWQEWQQHIMSATEIAAAQARKVRAEADAATSNIDDMLREQMKSWSPEKKATALYKQCLETEYPKQLLQKGAQFEPGDVKATCKGRYPLAQVE
jgi:hypothetical protein